MTGVYLVRQRLWPTCPNRTTLPPMSLTDFQLVFVGDDDEPAWALRWRAGDETCDVALECDVEADGQFSRGDCMGEISPHLPTMALRDQFARATVDMGYPVTLADINAALAELVG